MSDGLDSAYSSAFVASDRVRRRVKETDETTIEFGSLFVFVLLAAIVALSAVLSVDGLTTFLFEGEVWVGFGADNDDDGGVLPGFAGILETSRNSGPTISNVSRIAFIVVIGQVIHRVNVTLASRSRYSSLLGITVFSCGLVIALGSTHRTLWVLSTQVLLLGYYAVAYATVVANTALRPLSVTWARRDE